MNSLDMRTVISSYMISNFICMLVIGVLWYQNRRRFAGLSFWLADFGLQWGAMLLVALRGKVPDILSMTASNTMIIGGTVILYMGLERFIGKRGTQIQNYILLGVFPFFHAYFVYAQPDLTGRTILFSLGLLVICSQCAWLLIRRVDREMLPITGGTGIVFIFFCLVSILRIGFDLDVPMQSDFFHSSLYDTLAVLTYQMLFVILTFNLLLMVNRRLVMGLNQDIDARKRAEQAVRESEERFFKAFHSSPDAILITRLSDGKIVEVNEGFCHLSEYTREEALSSSTMELSLWANPQDRGWFVAELHKSRRIQGYELDFRIKSGKILRCIYSGEVIQLGDEAHVLSVVRDITARKETEEVVRLRLKLWEYAGAHSIIELMQKALDEIGELTDSPIGFYHFVDEDQDSLTLQAWSTRTLEEFCKAEGAGMHYPIGEAGVWVDCVHQRRPVIHNDYAALPHRKGLPAGHAEIRRELVVPTIWNGRIVSILGIGNKQTEYDESDINLISYIADVIWIIVEQKRANEQIRQLNARLEQLAMTDDLTGLENRRSFFKRGEEEIKRAHRYQSPLSLLMLDIDDFKRVNDTHGHDFGDLLLQCVAHSLKSNIREIDILARLGGEEFGILLPNTSLEDAARLGERLRLAVEGTTCTSRDRRMSVTVSVGVASCCPDLVNLDAVLRVADQAMYQAKNQGRNRVVRMG